MSFTVQEDFSITEEMFSSFRQLAVEILGEGASDRYLHKHCEIVLKSKYPNLEWDDLIDQCQERIEELKRSPISSMTFQELNGLLEEDGWKSIEGFLSEFNGKQIVNKVKVFHGLGLDAKIMDSLIHRYMYAGHSLQEAYLISDQLSEIAKINKLESMPAELDRLREEKLSPMQWVVCSEVMLELEYEMESINEKLETLSFWEVKSFLRSIGARLDLKTA